MDGIDAAVLTMDGDGSLVQGAAFSQPYDLATKTAIRGVLGGGAGQAEIDAVGQTLTRQHAEAVNALLHQSGLAPGNITVVGFHGHTIQHLPQQRRTWQIGDGALLAALTGIDVVDDFRGRDVAAGGQGAPLAPLYHRALATALPKPLAVLNIGGVANVTWIGHDDQMLAFDTGPGNALIDDWVRRCGRGEMDQGGRLAGQGGIDNAALSTLLANSYFDQVPPKSLDRDDFYLPLDAEWSAEDGAATLTAFTAQSVARARAHMPQAPLRWLVCGGGRHNPALMGALDEALGFSMEPMTLVPPVEPVEAVGWRGDFLEAEAFAYLALRSLDGLPLSLPGTTGVPQPLSGGRFNAYVI